MIEATPQHEFWRRESLRYFERNYGTADLTAVPAHPHLVRLLAAHPLTVVGGAVLEVGCAGANNLRYLVRQLGARRGVGVESSPETVAVLAGALPQLDFVASDASRLPFATGAFDVVLVRGVLCWVERDRVLQALGELVRVTREYLIVSDFAPQSPYSTVYAHRPAYRTYKMAYLPLLAASGLVRPLTTLTSDDDTDWTRVQSTVFRKLTAGEGFPLRTEAEVRASERGNE